MAKSRSLEDENKNILCYEDLFLESNLPDWSETGKQLYDDNNELIASFDYNKDGSIRSMWGMLANDAGAKPDSSLNRKEIRDNCPGLLERNPYYFEANILYTLA